MKHTIRQLCLAVALLSGIFNIAAHAQLMLTNGLVAYYPFNGNVNDASGNGYNATNHNVSWGTNRFGLVSASGQFNGNSSYVILPSALTTLMSGTNPISVSAWVEASPAVINAGNKTFFGIGAGSQNEMFGMLIQSGIFVYSEFGATYNVTSSVPICDNAWHQCIASFDGTNLSLYVDGVFRKAHAVISNRVNTRGTIGIRCDLAAEYWNGGVSNVRIYNRAVSTNEVSLLYQYESGSPNLPSATPALQLGTTNLVVGGSYQIQTSSNLVTWQNYRVPFVATSTNAPQYVNMTSSSGFFRILAAP